MGALGLAERAATAAGDHGLGASRVRRAGLPCDVALALELVDDPRETTAREQQAVGDVLHAHAPARSLCQAQQHLVAGRGETLLLGQLTVELAQEPGMRTQEAAPCGELADGEGL